MVVGAGGAVLGRSRDCEITVEDPNVSRRHAEIKPSGGSWVIRDMGSTNGVHVNGQRVDAPKVLRAGDRIEMGTSTMIFELEA
jgi:pSer/pThr/pTyr-binding forkhead associated (FHA) protein